MLTSVWMSVKKKFENIKITGSVNFNTPSVIIKYYSVSQFNHIFAKKPILFHIRSKKRS